MKPPVRTMIAVAAPCLAALAGALPASGQENPPAASAPDSYQAPEGPPTEDSTETAKPESKFHRMFFDETDGKLDFSRLLEKGGFFPMPVIITEPAVDGGFGIVAQFITLPKEKGGSMTRRMAGAVKTGNGSYGYGYYQSGSIADGRISYKFGAGRGKVTLTAYPRLLPAGLEYTNKYDYGVLGSVQFHLADRRFSIGPLLDFRQIHSKIDIAGLPEQLDDVFDRKLNTGAVGLGMHFDDRDNALSPTKGSNLYAEGKFNLDALGSDREFQSYALHGYGFQPLSSDWRVGAKVEVDAVRGSYPAYFASSINLRGVEARRYQGGTAVSTELEATRRLDDRWSIVGFAGMGYTDAGGKRIYADSGTIVAGGAGFRYRIARKLGLDAGVDVAVGPGGAIFYLQFGHAWGFGMD
ncbi:BamA/TamA family outer membrane protein [Sphingopyxis indica]|uniref:Surface antigen n=1 Tax=Sphingopyxis indica TaxID=436663 RepID=A0A239DD88_9SPHN|nr:BamA/TamA family outer membrane protein [Sphingopyxis indica]SNS30355.1 Surface antigen [Sphingopyxis indica]